MGLEGAIPSRLLLHLGVQSAADQPPDGELNSCQLLNE